MTGNILGLISLIISGIATFIAWKSWIKNRAVYKIEIEQYFTAFKGENNNNRILGEKLSSGKYSVLKFGDKAGIGQGYVHDIILARIKK